MAHFVFGSHQPVGIGRPVRKSGQRLELPEVETDREIALQVRQIELVAVKSAVARRSAAGQAVASVSLERRAVTQRGVDFVFLYRHPGNQVYDGAHRVRTVQHRRSAADDLDPGDVVHRNPRIVDVAVSFAGDTLPIDQEQHIARVQPLERQRRTVTGLVELDTGKLPFERLLQSRHAAPLDVFGRNHPGDNRGVFQHQRRARSRHHHFIHIVG